MDSGFARDIALNQDPVNLTAFQPDIIEFTLSISGDCAGNGTKASEGEATSELHSVPPKKMMTA